jgi:hypothetical protein
VQSAVGLNHNQRTYVSRRIAQGKPRVVNMIHIFKVRSLRWLQAAPTIVFRYRCVLLVNMVDRMLKYIPNESKMIGEDSFDVNIMSCLSLL